MIQKISSVLVSIFVSHFIFSQRPNLEDLNFHTFLGINVDYDGAKTNGLYINGVYKHYGAEKAGLKRGDTLIAVNSIAVHDYLEFKKICDDHGPGDHVELTIIREHHPQKLVAILSEWPEFLKYKTAQWYRDVQGQGKEEIRTTKLGLQARPDWVTYGIKVTSVNSNSKVTLAGL